MIADETSLLCTAGVLENAQADYYRDVFGFRISPKNIRLDYYILYIRGMNSEKPEFIENIDSEMAFPDRYQSVCESGITTFKLRETKTNKLSYFFCEYDLRKRNPHFFIFPSKITKNEKNPRSKSRFFKSGFDFEIPTLLRNCRNFNSNSRKFYEKPWVKKNSRNLQVVIPLSQTL